jgi:hypothetical protein
LNIFLQFRNYAGKHMQHAHRSWLVWAIVLLPLAVWGNDWPDSRALGELTRVTASASLNNSPFSVWEVLTSTAYESPVLAYGAPVNAGRNADEALQTVLNAANCRSDFEFFGSQSVKNLSRTFYLEMRSGKPVIGGRADLVFADDGRLSRWSLRAHDQWPTVDYHSLNMTTAAAALAAVCEPAAWRADEKQCWEAWFPDPDNRVLRPVWWVRISGEQPHQKQEGLVDALSGAVIRHWPGIATDVISGAIRGPYWPEFLRDAPQIGVHPYEAVSVNGYSVLTNLQGAFSREAGTTANLFAQLNGTYVSVENDAGAFGSLSQTVTAPFSVLTWDWTTGNATAAELNLFYHTSFIHQWYKVLDPSFNGLDYPVPAVANYGDGYDNAFWDGYGTYYGSGGQYSNFGMFSDVIYHEYTHGVTSRIYGNYPLPYIDESGAMNEAWSDYIGCSINNDPYEAEYILLNMFSSYFRNLDNDLVYPQDWYGEVHYDSRFVSGALWDIRAVVGAEITDSLAHFSRYAYTDNFADYFIAVLETDDNDNNLANGTPHGSLIAYAFGRHGIGPGNQPEFVVGNLAYCADGSGSSVGDGDRYYEPGETIEFRFDVANNAPLYVPSAQGVQISLLVNDTVLVIQYGSQSIDSLASGQTHTVVPILLTIPPGSSDYWLTAEIYITANGGDAQFHYPINLMIGTPHVLIVEDDPTSEVEHFIPDALKARQRIFERVELAQNESLAGNLLPDSGLVIWLSGDEDGSILTPQDITLLQNYMAAGGRVVLSGQYIGDPLEGTAFAHDVLHVAIDTGYVFSRAVLATAAPLVPNEWYVISGGNGAGNQREQTAITPLDSSREIARYNQTGSGAIAAVECANGKCLLLGFGIEAISGMGTESTDLPTFFDRVYAWKAGLSASDPNPPIAVMPAEWSLGPAYPNPFNGATTISYIIPVGQTGELIVFDVLGREVDHLALAQSSGTIAWRPQAASGIYFAQARWNNGQTDPIRLLLLK